MNTDKRCPASRHPLCYPQIYLKEFLLRFSHLLVFVSTSIVKVFNKYVEITAGMKHLSPANKKHTLFVQIYQVEKNIRVLFLCAPPVLCSKHWWLQCSFNYYSTCYLQIKHNSCCIQKESIKLKWKNMLNTGLLTQKFIKNLISDWCHMKWFYPNFFFS